MNPKYKLVSIHPPVFTESNEDLLELVDTCSICSKHVTNGIRCNKAGCKEVVHLRCALEKRAKILSKNGQEIIAEEVTRGQTYNYSNQIWSISYGLFKKAGRDPNEDESIKINEKDLEKSKFFSEASFILEKDTFGYKQSEYEESVISEINGDSTYLFGKKSVFEEICIEYRAFCPNHKEEEPSYCLCGVNEEKKSVLDEQDKMKAEGQLEVFSIYCNNCNTWYHQSCVNYIEPSKRTQDRHGKNNFYSCPKCCALEQMCSDPAKFMRFFESEVYSRKKLARGNSNFLHERMNHILKRDFVHIVDYMIAMKSIARGMNELSFENIRYWQREMPFSIEFLLRVKFRSSKLEAVII